MTSQRDQAAGAAWRITPGDGPAGGPIPKLWGGLNEREHVRQGGRPTDGRLVHPVEAVLIA